MALKKSASAVCSKCGAGTLTSYVIAHKQVYLCTNCYNRWLDLRNQAVGEAFETYIQSKNSTKGQHPKPMAGR